MNPLADREGFIIVYPDGIDKGWNDGRGTTKAEQQQIDDVGFVKALIDHLARHIVHLDRNRIYATGMSNGAIFSHRLGCELADELAAIAPVAGIMAENIAPQCSPSHPLPIIAFHGTADPFTPYKGGASRSGRGGRVLSAEGAIAFWAAKNSCFPSPTVEALPDRIEDGTTVTRTTYTGCNRRADAVLYTIHEGGHTWPGGPQYLSTRLIGRASQDISASELMWEFFKRHPKR